MTTTEAENLAQRLHDSHGGQSCAAIDMIREQAAEIERLNAVIAKLAAGNGVEPVAWTVQMGIDLLKSGASITVFPKSGERDVPLYTHPAPDHTALLRQALDALRLPCDRWSKQQTEIVNAAIAAIEGALK